MFKLMTTLGTFLNTVYQLPKTDAKLLSLLMCFFPH